MMLGVTGHRPPRLFPKWEKPYSVKACARLKEFAVDMLETYQPEKVFTGMALGWDVAVADACLELDIPFVAALPFAGQENRWPDASKERFGFLCEKAVEIKIVCDGGYAPYKMHERDKWIVANSGLVVALWDGVEDGGTWLTVSDALKNGVGVDNLFDKWEAFRDEA